MAGISWEILAKHNLWGMEKWFVKYGISPESLDKRLLDKLSFLNDEQSKILSELSQIKYEISFALAMEIRKRFWEKMDPEVLKDLRSLKTQNCRHLKGDGKVGVGVPQHSVKDYNLSMHTFIDGSSRIRCLGCGKKWLPNQPGWDQALNMMKLSTNTGSSSEVPLKIERKK